MTPNQYTQMSRAIDAAERGLEDHKDKMLAFNRLRDDLMEIDAHDSLILYDE